jgi:hypothetical protein
VYSSPYFFAELAEKLLKIPNKFSDPIDCERANWLFCEKFHGMKLRYNDDEIVNR